MKYSIPKKTALLGLSVLAAGSHAFVPPNTPLGAPTMASLRHKHQVAMFGPNKDDHPDETLTEKKQGNKSSMNPGATAATAALVAALALAPLPSDAAMSGGRLGGSFSAPRTSSYSSRPSYSSGYSRGYSSGYYSRPSVAISPIITPFAPVTPFYSPFSSPFYYGAPGVISFRGPGFFSLLALGGMAFAVSNLVRGIGSGVRSSVFQDERDGAVSALGPGTSVAQISIALDVSNRDDPNSILGVLDRLAATSKTDSRVGIQQLSSQVAVELLRRKSSIVSSSTRYQHFRSREKAQREFQSISVKERSKFESEIVSKYGGVDYNPSRRSAGGGVDGKATMAVVTLVLAIDGDSTKLPKIRSLNDVEEALRKLAADTKVSDCLQAAEILWTPEDRSETLTLRDVVADYPELTSV